MTLTACPACGGDRLERFHEQLSIPTNSCLLMDDEAEASGYPRGDLELAVCPDCGFVMNVAFDPTMSEYSARYEETQAFSPRFVDFAQRLASRWVEQHDLAGKTVVEIGCGKGEFLLYMAEAGIGRGIGIDPGVHPERLTGAAAAKCEWIADFYSEDYGELDADAVVCRHTLEHIQPVHEFMTTVRRAIGDRLETVVLFELPDVLRVLQEVAFWDVYYEHCSYFTPGSLARLFRATGFEVTALELDYDDQYILIEARPSPNGAASGAPLPMEDDIAATVDAAGTFGEGFEKVIAGWHRALQQRAAEGERSVIWGSGSKGVSFLTSLAARGGRDLVDYAVDINPHKHGKFMAGSGQRIVSPEFLVDYEPSLVILMNPIYLDEVRADLDRLGLTCEVRAV